MTFTEIWYDSESAEIKCECGKEFQFSDEQLIWTCDCGKKYKFHPSYVEEIK